VNKTLVVARWEYIEKVKSKAFLISLLLTPAIMLVMSIVPGLLASREDTDTKLIGAIDLSGEIAGPLSTMMMENYRLPNGQPNYLVEVIASGTSINLDEASGRADNMVLRDHIEGYVVIGQNVLADSVIEYRSKNVGDIRLQHRLEETVKRIISERKLVLAGLDVKVLDQLRFPLEVRTVKLTKGGEKKESEFFREFLSAYVFLMMLFLLILTSGQLLVRSVIEEKSNRIVEVLVSSCPANELMAGKVLGLSALGFTQMGFWALIGVVLSLTLGFTLISVGHALLLVLYFVLGYLLFAGVFIAAGSPVTTEQEAQQVNSYLVLLLVLPMAIVLPAVQNPNATWIKVLGYIPFFTPMMMAIRIPIQMPPAFEIIATTSLLLLSIVLVMIVAGRVFRVAILATGKKPTLNEIVGWIKTG
jgi:ABC-2 type transport system permease protein